MKTKVRTRQNREENMRGSLGRVASGDLKPRKGYSNLGSARTSRYRTEANHRPHHSDSTAAIFGE